MPTQEATASARALRALRTAYDPDIARANLDKGRGKRKLKPCTCGQEPHKQPCPVYYREMTRKSRASNSGVTPDE